MEEKKDITDACFSCCEEGLLIACALPLGVLTSGDLTFFFEGSLAGVGIPLLDLLLLLLGGVFVFGQLFLFARGVFAELIRLGVEDSTL